MCGQNDNVERILAALGTRELDSYRFHNTRHSWQRGYERERAAYARGDAYRGYTWRDVFEDRAQMLAELNALL